MVTKTFYAYYLHFDSPLHIGDSKPQEYGNTELFIRSDTLFAAIIASWAKIGRPIPSDGNPGFHISSLFPFTTVQGEITHFFPKILKPFKLKGTVDFAKKLKKLQWLDKDYFEYQINDTTIENFGDQDQNDIQGIFCSKKQVGEVFKTQVSQRVVIPRIREGNEDPRPFYMERIFFKKKSGLFFLFKGSDKMAEKMEEALNILQYEGLGTDRTVGNGLFSYEKGSISIKLPDDSKYRTNLSLFCPGSSEELNSIIDKNSSYQFLKRGGWITTQGYQTFRKKAIHMFREGSIFNTSADTLGRPNINITPEEKLIELDHTIWRNGSSIFLPVKI